MIPAGEPCLRFQAALPDYLGGDARPEVPAHAAQCEPCRCLLADLELIRQAGAQYQDEEPPARLWVNIRSALVAEGMIHEPSQRRWRPRNARWVFGYQLPVAVAAAIAIVAVVLFKAPGYLVHSPAEPAAYTLHPAAFMRVEVGPRDLASLQQTAAELEKSFQANQSYLDPSTKNAYAKSLSSIDSEIRECEASMKQEPEDGLAGDYLSRAYAEKTQMLQTALEYNLR